MDLHLRRYLMTDDEMKWLLIDWLIKENVEVAGPSQRRPQSKQHGLWLTMGSGGICQNRLCWTVTWMTMPVTEEMRTRHSGLHISLIYATFIISHLSCWSSDTSTEVGWPMQWICPMWLTDRIVVLWKRTGMSLKFRYFDFLWLFHG